MRSKRSPQAAIAMGAPAQVGLSSVAALRKLCNDGEATLRRYEGRVRVGRTLRRRVVHALTHGVEGRRASGIHAANYCWLYSLACFGLSAALLLGAALDTSDAESSAHAADWRATVAVCGGLALTFTVFNTLLACCTTHWAETEFYRKAASLVERIRRTAELFERDPDAKLLCPSRPVPVSEAIELVACYRDGQLVMLPTVLLVRGDVILARPGREVPLRCHPLGDPANVFDTGQIYVPQIEYDIGTGGVQPATAVNCVVLLSGIEEYLQSVLGPCDTDENGADNRPPTGARPASPLEHELRITLHGFIEHWLLPASVLAAAAIAVYRSVHVLVAGSSLNFVDVFIVTPAAIVLPMLGMSTPGFIWLLSAFDTAALLAAFQAQNEDAGGSRGYGRSMSWSAATDFAKWQRRRPSADSVALFSTQRAGDAQRQAERDSDAAAGESSSGAARDDKSFSLPPVRWSLVLRHWLRVITGDAQHLHYSANLIRCLGNMTTLAAVDKKGLLSWPNPTPEKVFFIRQRDTDMLELPEVLDVTADPSTAFAVRFDDQSWRRHLANLRPIALNIGLNGCDLDPVYESFHDHLSAVTVGVPRTIAVVNRRCCCNLASLIDPTIAKTNAEPCDEDSSRVTLCAYKRSCGAPPMAGLTQHRTPIANVFATVIDCEPLNKEEKESSVAGYRQVMCQGTADLLLDACTHYWDGTRVAPLTHSLRRSIVDFYQRHSMTSYCVAYSYRPVRSAVDRCMADVYVDWPLAGKAKRRLADTTWAAMPTSNRLACAPSVGSDTATTASSSAAALGERALSIDSLLADEFVEPPPTLCTAESCLRHALAGHIFLGMVTLQYQAKLDVVNAVEHLEKACIRFVHFSKENELRSRIFAEKLGLEAGWNCHISLAEQGSLDWSTRINEYKRQYSFGANSNAMNNRLSGSPAVKPRRPSTTGGRLRRHTLPAGLHIDSFVSLTVAAATTTAAAAALADAEDDSDFDEPFDPQIPALVQHRISVKTWSADRASDSEGEDVNVDDDQCLINANPCMVPPNKAQLPVGVRQIRPHLQTVDNVPLLVHLFTDSSGASAMEMIDIMQEYGELVVGLGSALNPANAKLFCQANAAVAVEPLHPVSCVRRRFDDLDCEASASNSLRACDLAASIISLPCSLLVRQGESFNLMPLIGLARHRLSAGRAVLLFVLFSSLATSLLQLLGTAGTAFLHTPLSLAQTFWFSVVIVPVIAATLTCTRCDLEYTLRLAMAKNENWLASKVLRRNMISFGIKFAPPAVLAAVAYLWALTLVCDCYAFATNRRPHIPSRLLWMCSTPVNASVVSHCPGSPLAVLLVARHAAAGAFLLYLLVVSAGFVHYRQSAVRASSLRNVVWTVVAAVLLLAHAAYAYWDLEAHGCWPLVGAAIPWYFYTVLVALTIPLFVCIELYKHKEIKLYLRDQRRRKLNFGTKLGMNSPY